MGDWVSCCRPPVPNEVNEHGTFVLPSQPVRKVSSKPCGQLCTALPGSAELASRCGTAWHGLVRSGCVARFVSQVLPADVE